MDKMRALQNALVLGFAIIVTSACVLVSDSSIADSESVIEDGVTYALTESGGGIMQQCLLLTIP